MHTLTIMTVMVIIMTMNSDSMSLQILMNDLLLALIGGGVSSFLVWFVPARVIMPKIKCSGFVQLDSKRKVSLVNESKHYDAYDLTCYIEYLDNKGNDIFREVSKIPLLEKDTTMDIKLRTMSFPQKVPKENKPSKQMFLERETRKLRVTITYQNKYGSKKSTPTWLIDYD